MSETKDGDQPVASMVYFRRDGSQVEDCLPVVGYPQKHVRADLITRVVPLVPASRIEQLQAQLAARVKQVRHLQATRDSLQTGNSNLVRLVNTQQAELDRREALLRLSERALTQASYDLVAGLDSMGPRAYAINAQDEAEWTLGLIEAHFKEKS